MKLKIVNLDRNPEGDIITVVHYEVSKTDGEITKTVYGAVSLETGETFIPFNQITEDIVKNWLDEKLDLVSIEAVLDAQIAEQRTPKIVSGLPWSSYNIDNTLVVEALENK